MEDAAPLNGAVGPEVGPAGEDQTMAVRRLLAEAAQVSRELGQLAEDMVAQSEVGGARRSG